VTGRPADVEGALEPAMAVCLACVAGSRLDGAAFTVMTSSLARETLCASDAVIAAVEELQFSVGEGPCLDAFTIGRPVLISDLGAAWAAIRWPVFAAEVAAQRIGGLFAFPMQLGAITGGVCELYRRDPGPLSVDELAQVLRAVDGATLALLRLRAGDPVEGLDAGWPDDHRPGRAQVYQAIGMLTVQLGVPAEEAFARLRGHAYAHGRLVAEVADAIVSRRLRLNPDPR
jgi:ANTAR domain